MALDELLTGNVAEWLEALPAYQRDPLRELIERGLPVDEVIDRWTSASAENTYRFGTELRTGDKSLFREKFLLELEGFLCGSDKYSKEREGLFGEKSAARTYVVSAIAVGIAPYLGVTGAFLAPIVALTLASLGKISVNSWCEMRKTKGGSEPGNSPQAG